MEDVEQIQIRMTEPSEVESRVDWFLKPDLFSYPKYAYSVCKLQFDSGRSQTKAHEFEKVKRTPNH